MVLKDGQPISVTDTKTPMEVSNELQLSGVPLVDVIPCKEIKSHALASIRSPETNEDEDADTDNESRAPIVLVAVVDKSGSMSGAKMNSLKDTLHFIIKEMTNRDRLAIVEYDTNVTVSLNLTKMNESGRQQAKSVTDALKAGSATNLSSGLLEGLRLIPTDLDNKTVVSTLLLTDGLANHGIRSTKGIISMIQSNQTKGVGRCTINTFGFGKDHDASMLKEISDVAEGMYYFIENEDSIASAFADCLGGLLSVSAQGIELTIESCNGVTIEKVHALKPANIVEPGKVYRIDIGDLQEGEERDIPIDFTVPESSACDDFELLKFTVTYFDLKSESMKESSTTIKITRGNEVKPANPKVDRHRNRVKSADATEAAVALADKGNISEARELLQNTINEIKASISANDPLCISLVAGLQASLSTMVDKISYRKEGQFQMNGYCKAWKMQRSNAVVSNANRSPVPMASMACQSSAMPSIPQPPEASLFSFETKNKARMKKKFTKKC